MPPGGRGESSNSPMDFTEIKALHSGLGLGGGAQAPHLQENMVVPPIWVSVTRWLGALGGGKGRRELDPQAGVGHYQG